MKHPDRYHRQQLLDEIGPAGQQQLRRGSAVIVGIGALGTHIVELLTRAGIGRLRLVDRDLVELTNLQRQVLFTEADAREAMPKAVAAARRLEQINSDVELDPVVADFDARNAERLAGDVDVILDGTDNFETRFLINDIAVKHGRPYVYGGAVATHGMVYTVQPGRPCLRCVFDEPAERGETCDTAGVLASVTSIVAAMQTAEAMKLLTGTAERVNPKLVRFDPWRSTHQMIDVGEPDPACPCCGARRFEYLDNPRCSATANLCGRNAVQFTAPQQVHVDLPPLAARLAAHGRVRCNEHLLRAELTEHDQSYELTIFPDGRTIIHGTADPTRARSLYSKYVGL